MCGVQTKNVRVWYKTTCRRTDVLGTEDERTCGVQKMNVRVGYRR